MLLSPYDHILYFRLIRGQSRAQARERTKKVMEDLGLWEHRDKLAADLSGALRQGLIIAMAVVADPEVLFLDEPTIGLDPLGRRSVWHMLRELTRKGATILLTTHYLDEAEILADHLLIVDKGRTVFLGTVEEAKGETGVGMRVIIESAAGNGAGPPEVLEPLSAEEILSIVERGLRERTKVTAASYALGLSVSGLVVALPGVLVALVLLLLSKSATAAGVVLLLGTSVLLWIGLVFVGFAIGATTKNARRANSIPQVLSIALGFLPPVYYPLERLHDIPIAQAVAMLIPTTHAAQLAKYYFGLISIPAWQVWVGWTYLLGFAALMGFLASRRAHWVDP